MARKARTKARTIDATITVDGLKELSSALGDIDPKLRRHLRDELKKIAEPVRSTAAARAPHRRGRLARSIRIYPRATGVAIGSPLVYAPVIEFAHKGGYSSLTKKHGPAPRFIIPAVEKHQDAIERDLAPSIDELLARILPQVG